MKTRVMYIEAKSGGLAGPARIGRVRFSKTGATLYYAGKSFQSLKGDGFKSNYYDVETGERYWISGPKKRGGDQLYATSVAVTVDDDAHEEYWSKIRGVQVPRRSSDDAV
ncbi:MAG: 1-deoxy-D-xylulose-5-phosphate synthase [Rhodoferax sp.]|nr:1-deoxy-D-xylulose-5-phosphate synthase [Rhodoferax sp.]HPW30913.1 1-deoxy-D-xylulose-5-phosphate synthase [Rhodoferax sp.]